jgi:hypothetical protein
MYSALYYPHSQIRNPQLLKTALLLWDELHFIVPDEYYRADIQDRDQEEAYELIGRKRIPSETEKRDAHVLIEDFVKRGLPDSFRLTASDNDYYEIYPQKLLYNTWKMLEDAGMVRNQLDHPDQVATKVTGLSLMSILADCCAGEHFARVTDQDSAYAVLAGALLEQEKASVVDVARQELIPIPIKIANLETVPLKKLIDFRKNERNSKTGFTELRHRFVDSVNDHAKKLALTTNEADHREVKRLYEQQLTNDLRSLRNELNLDAQQVLGSKDFLLPVIGSLATFVPILNVPVVGIGLSIAAIGGLVSLRAKFAQSRSKILQAHPMAYLYEAVSAGSLVHA